MAQIVEHRRSAFEHCTTVCCRLYALPAAVEQTDAMRPGKLRALAVTTANRHSALPDVPSMRELLPEYEASGWYGVGAPRGTPREIIDTLNREINAALADPKVKARLADLGIVPAPETPAEFGRFIATETEKWAKVIRAANIKPD